MTHLGARRLPDGSCAFRVWAPLCQLVEVVLESGGSAIPHALSAGERGYHCGTIANLPPGALYRYRLDRKASYPDPASRFQPQGVHGPSQVVDRQYAWKIPHWTPPPLEDWVLYELHVGAFSPAGTFAGAAEKLGHLRELGINAVELMPVAAFPGQRNWGYDGAYPFAPAACYGHPDQLKALVDACHQAGLAVVLDVVYNHLGPEGNYLGHFGPYFTKAHCTPWGAAINLDRAYSDEVRAYFLANARQWLVEYNMDGLRLDACQALFDQRPTHLLAELAQAVAAWERETGRPMVLIAENDLNNANALRSPDNGGWGLRAQWNDDFHHALHRLLTGESSGYYMDYGRVADLAETYGHGFAYRGRYSEYRKVSHGSDTDGLSGQNFVVYAQNHDQVGNRARGDRLLALAGPESARLALAATLLAPMVPMLFMGEEWGETNPFAYFVDFHDPKLGRAVRRARNKELKAFGLRGTAPNPTDETTFATCKLNWNAPAAQGGAAMLRYTAKLLELRRTVPAFAKPDMKAVEVSFSESGQWLAILRKHQSGDALLLLHFGQVRRTLPRPEFLSGATRMWEKALDSADTTWGGPGMEAPAQFPAHGNFDMPARSACVWLAPNAA